MKLNILITLGLFLVVFTVQAQSLYYVSNDGNDNNNGLGVNSAFQTLNKVNTLNLQIGDRILFRRGDTFRGTLTIRQSGNATNNIIVDAYGTGDKPVLSGSTLVSGWTNIGGNIWQASCSSCGSAVTGLYRNGLPLTLGRYPNFNTSNSGYITVQSHIGKTQLTSQQPLTTNWVNAEAVIRPTQFILDRARITQQSGNVLTLNNNSAYDLSDGFGFFIQNHPSTLDQNDEWYYDATNKTFQVYYALGNPNGQSFSATVQPGVIILSNVSYIVLQNLKIAESLNTNLSMAFVSNIIVRNLDIINSGEDAVGIYGSGSNILFENNQIYRANNNAIDIIDYASTTFRGNVIRSIGLSPGRGKSGDGQYRGLTSFSTRGILIENNIVDSIGYSAITFLGNTIIQRNVISNFCVTKSDGGGLYTVNESNGQTANTKILSNVVSNGIGVLDGQPVGYGSAANGIYLDDCTQNVEVKGNTVFSCNGLGIYLHATTSTTVTENISYNNSEQFVIYHNFGRCPARNNIVQNNVFAGKVVSQGVARYESLDTDLGSYGVFDNNYYARPFDDAIKILVGYKSGTNQISSYLSLSEWQRLFNKDLNSRNSPIIYKGFITNGYVGNRRLDNTFTSGVDGWYPTSYYNNGNASWDNTSRIDGGSLRVDFPVSSNQPGSYVFAYNGIGSVSKGKSYVMQFDAVASMPNKSIQVFIRQRNAPYQDLDNRYSFLIDNTRGRYEVAFTSTTDESDAIVMIRVGEDGQSVWFDNITFQEAFVARDDPDGFIKLLVNNTLRDSTFLLGGNYKDVKNQSFSGQITLTPFTSLLLLRDQTQPGSTDLSLSLRADKRAVNINENVRLLLRLRREAGDKINGNVQAQWSIKLPSNMQFVSGDVVSVSNGILSGSVVNLPVNTDAVFPFIVRLLSEGLYRVAAQITSTNISDTDSTPSSGTADGEDDSVIEELRTSQPGNIVYTSPNPNQKIIPAVRSSQPIPDISKADLSVSIALSKRSLSINDIVSVIITVSNAGGQVANGIQIQNQLPMGLQFVSGSGWFFENGLLKNNIGTVNANSSVSVNIQLRTTASGYWENKVQISAAGTSDPDSTPGNGFANGEDDQTTSEVRVR